MGRGQPTAGFTRGPRGPTALYVKSKIVIIIMISKYTNRSPNGPVQPVRRLCRESSARCLSPRGPDSGAHGGRAA